jgi:hypothetical protein
VCVPVLQLEPQGVQRVVAALQAHAWPGLELKDHLPSVGTSAMECLPGRIDHRQPADQDEQAAPDSGGRANGADWGVEAQGSVSDRLAVEDFMNGDSESIHATPAEESELAEFERLLAEMAGRWTRRLLGWNACRRRHCQARLGISDIYPSGCTGARTHLESLPDDQRREQASQLALRLMAAFGIDDGDSDDDTDPSKPHSNAIS